MNKKIKFEIEHIVRCSPSILYNFIATSSGLQEWFADDVVIKDEDTYHFKWQGSIEIAKVIDKEKDKFIRFRWVEEKNEDIFFEFAIFKTEISSQTILVITDFAEEDELEEQQLLYNNQIKTMLYKLGS